MDERRTDALVELVTGEPTSGYPLPDLPPEVRDLFDREDTNDHTDNDEPKAAQAPQNSEEAAPAPTTKPSRLNRKIRVDLRVVIGAGTLLGLDDEPGHLAGYGPIPADMARRLAKDATMRKMFTNPTTGIPAQPRPRTLPSTRMAL